MKTLTKDQECIIEEKARGMMLFAKMNPGHESSRCIVCKSPSVAVGVFIPKDRESAKRITDEPEGKDRVVVYMVCEKHTSTPELCESFIQGRLKDEHPLIDPCSGVGD